jgi:MoxR-like ATPase
MDPRTSAEKISEQIKRVFVGSDSVINLVLIGLFSGLHVLIEDIPGVGKTTLAKSLAAATGLDFGRIQFTPDLLPGDITGMTIWSQEKREFVFKEGAVMHQFILADEINRASARTQSALLEAMQEMYVTIDGTSYPLPQPFFVIATQNPSQFTGTFLLPEAQVDRFGISLSIGYPSNTHEITILDRFHERTPSGTIEPVSTAEEILKLIGQGRKVHTDPKIADYLVKIAERSRKSTQIRLGMSPRATGQLKSAAQAWAMIQGRDYVIPEDVRYVVHAVLRHRLILSAEAKLENRNAEQVISRIIDAVAMPTGI